MKESAEKNNSERIIVYGGAFNPPHLGHLACLVRLSKLPNYDRVLIVPSSPQRPDKESDTPIDLRLQLCGALITAFQNSSPASCNSSVQLDPIELESAATIRGSWELLQALALKYTTQHLTLAIGSDLLKDLPFWRHPEKIKQLPLIIIKRCGASMIGKAQEYKVVEQINDELPGISSTEIRALIKSNTNTPRNLEFWRQWMPTQVIGVLAEHGILAIDK
jgi:nicotinate-nucleotide adenylyltransferase